MNKPDLPIDSSALSELVCSRRYQLRCLYGLTVSNEDLSFGSAAHKWIELRDRQQPKDAIELGMEYKLADVAKLLVVTQSIPVLNTPIAYDNEGKPLIEWKLAIPYKQLPDCNVHLLATIDRVDHVNEYVRILDYKTTGKVRLDEVMNEYAMRLQVYFYLWLVMKYGYKFLSPEASEAVQNGKVFGQICLIGKNTNPVRIQNSVPYMLPADMMDEIERLVDDSIDKARVILHNATQGIIADREGFLYGACKGCAYNVICLTNDTQRQLEYMAGWPRETTPYDPMKFR